MFMKCVKWQNLNTWRNRTLKSIGGISAVYERCVLSGLSARPILAQCDNTFKNITQTSTPTPSNRPLPAESVRFFSFLNVLLIILIWNCARKESLVASEN